MKNLTIIAITITLLTSFLVAPEGARAAVLLKIPSSLGMNTGMVGYWTMDGTDINWSTNTMTDKSGNSNTGTITNMSTTTSPVSGKIGQALNFDGVNDVINAGSGSSLDDIQSHGGGGMSASFWIKPTSNTTGGVMGKGRASNGSGFWIIDKTSATNPARLTFSKEGSTDSTVSYNSFFTTNAWQHVVVTWNGSMTMSTGVVVYKNGVVVAQTSATDGSTANSDAVGTFCIGSNDNQPTRCNTAFSDEQLDEVRIYNRILSAAEIKQLYLMGR